MGEDVMIRPYRDDDERGWVVCRLLSFLDTAFFDDVRRSKERYEHPAIELVAERNGEIVGLLDAECEEEPGTVCEERPGLGAICVAVGRGAHRASTFELPRLARRTG